MSSIFFGFSPSCRSFTHDSSLHSMGIRSHWLMSHPAFFPRLCRLYSGSPMRLSISTSSCFSSNSAMPSYIAWLQSSRWEVSSQLPWGREQALHVWVRGRLPIRLGTELPLPPVLLQGHRWPFSSEFAVRVMGGSPFAGADVGSHTWTVQCGSHLRHGQSNLT